MSPDHLVSTRAGADFARHGPDQLRSTWPISNEVDMDSTQHGLGPNRLNLGLGRLGSTWTFANAVVPEPEPTRLCLDVNVDHANLARLGFETTRPRFRPTQFGSTWARGNSSLPRFGLTQLDLGPSSLG